jgi:hypothetical protein
MRRPTWTETLLLVLLGVVLTALVVRGDGVLSSEAHAGGGAAGSFIAIAGNGDKSDMFYVVDTDKKRICVYRFNNPGLRLVAVRAFDFDLEILDSTGDRTIEGRGATRGYVKAQVEHARRASKELTPPKKN